MSRALVVGLGHPDRGDDGVGVAVARVVQRLRLPDVDVVPGGEPLQLLDLWERYQRVVVVDSVRSPAPPGTVLVRNPVVAPLPSTGTSASSHSLDLAATVELARSLDRLPAQLVVVGVVGTHFARGASISELVRGGLDDAVRAVVVAAGLDTSRSSLSRSGAAGKRRRQA